MKRIYLDQMMWINLSKAYFNHNDGIKYKFIFTTLKEKIDEGKIIVPLSFINLIESARNKDIKHREQLAEIITLISKGYGIVPFSQELHSAEIQSPLFALYNINVKYNVYDICVGKGIEYILGQKAKLNSSSSELQECFNEYIKHPDRISDLIKNIYDKNFISNSMEEDNAILPLLSFLRKKRKEKYSKSKRYNSMVEDVANNYLIPITLKQIEYTGLDKEYFLHNIGTTENYKKFFTAMPSIDVFLTLCSYIENDLNRPLNKNDKNDIGFLSVTVPYCDIIITENEWAHVLISQKIDKKYDTILLNDLLDIQKVID